VRRPGSPLVSTRPWATGSLGIVWDWFRRSYGTEASRTCAARVRLDATLARTSVHARVVLMTGTPVSAPRLVVRTGVV